ncbi:MAG: cell envelope integrity EipB family protein [Gammaproteobacteria bacterium]|nr:MAG: cell envelope integrity EipB family protein [Gammaproteobacteria bacterium]
MLTYRRLLVLGTTLFLAGTVSGVVAAQSGAPGLLSHRAVYSMSKHIGSTASDITGVNGRLEITFEVACDGWRIEQYIGFRLYSSDGAGLEHLAQLSGWESTDGSDFWFNTRSYEGQELVEKLSGVARLGRPGGTGETHYAKPVKEVKPLPAGTIFPARHVVDLIAAARSGKQHLTRTVFDGSTLDSPYEITAFIGAERPPGDQEVPELVSKTRSWFFRLAYFKVAALEPSPEFEISAVLYENGVAGDMVYDYGDFSIDLKLRELEALPVQECG